MDGIDAIPVDCSSGPPAILATHNRKRHPCILDNPGCQLLDDLLAASLADVAAQSRQFTASTLTRVEAVAAVWLAEQKGHGKPESIPDTTGASRTVQAGQLFRASLGRA